jgi:hypothetical protein
MKRKLLLATLLFGSIMLTNCAKKGCTDTDAENFCTDCKKDDGSCTFKGSNVLWTKALQTGESINVKLDGVYQGNIGVNFSSAPTCGATGALTINKDLGKNKNKSYSYHAEVDSAGTITYTWDGTMTISANTCVSLELK